MKNALIRIIRSALPTAKPAKRVTDLPTIARRYGRGNVRIQLGRVMSSAEYKANKERVLRYAF